MVEMSTGIMMNVIAFKLGHFLDDILSGKPFDIVYHLEENEWNGNISKQLRVLDIKMSA